MPKKQPRGRLDRIRKQQKAKERRSPEWKKEARQVTQQQKGVP